MNIRKVLQYNVVDGIIEVELSYITKGWRKIFGYKTRGYKNRVKRIGWSRMLIDNPTETKHAKRNLTHRLCSQQKQ
jgi:hypothetical protein